MVANSLTLPKKNDLKQLLESSNTRRRALAALLRGLRATRSYYDAFRKQTVTEQDYKTQSSCAELLMAYDVGKPIERKEIIERKIDTMESLRERMKKSPALLTSMEQLLAELKTKVLDPVEIPVSPH
jgi:hypothetical protein